MKKNVKLLISCLFAGAFVVLMSSSTILNGWSKGEANWMHVKIPANYDFDKAFSTALDLLSEKYEMGVVNQEEGYARTAWKFCRKPNGKIDKSLRTRVTIKLTHDGKKLSVKTEVQKLIQHNWVDGYNDIESYQARDELQEVLR